MKRTIAPKQTFYNEHVFRSHLEAKWAMFFDLLDIKWFYEPEVYPLVAGTSYLPDFWLPGFSRRDGGDFYVEVKPKGFSSPKAVEFARQYRNQILIAAGDPCAGPHDHYLWNKHDGELVLSDSVFHSKYLPRGGHAHEYRLFVFDGGCYEPSRFDIVQIAAATVLARSSHRSSAVRV